MTSSSLITIVFLMAGVLPQTTVLDARQWWNFHELRVPDDRAHVVLLFSTSEGGKVEPLLTPLHRLDQQRDVLVVGLSPDRPERVKKFIDKHRIRFLIGAGSRACLRLGGRRLPRLLLVRSGLDAASPNARSIFPGTPEGLKKLVAQMKADSGRNARHLPIPTADQLDDNTPVAQLRLAALQGDRGARRRALEILRVKVPPEQFMDVCDEVLMAPPPPRAAKHYWLRAQWYGEVAYLRHLADPNVKEKQPFLSPASDALERLEPADVAFLTAYKLALTEKSVKELRDVYLQRLSDAPLDLVIREQVISNLIDHALNGQEQALNVLMTIAPDEPDTYLRWCIVLGIGSVCHRDDSDHAEVIKFLEDMLETEEDIRRVRPTIIAILEHLYSNAR